MFDATFGENVVSGAVIGTFGAFAGTLAAYKFFEIKVGNKFRMFVIAAVFGMVGLSLMELVLSMFGASVGLFGFGTLGMLTVLEAKAMITISLASPCASSQPISVQISRRRSAPTWQAATCAPRSPSTVSWERTLPAMKACTSALSTPRR